MRVASREDNRIPEHKAATATELLKFSALASSLAIFMDAAVAHAMIWGNDPFWTYWVTDTLLMATVFGLGTAWLGTGLVRGAIITAVHMILLTVYYWALSPIGLPGHPEWLDLEHTWLTGLPVHFAIYYLGYVLALWLWRRRAAAVSSPVTENFSSAMRLATAALILSVAVVVVTGASQTLLLGRFPGVTWFVMRIAVAFPFTMAWWVIAGMDRSAAVGGGVMMGLLLTTYSHYLGPIGLPNASFRLVAENPPPAVVQWLSYRQEFLVLLPVTIAIGIAGFWVASRITKREVRGLHRGTLVGAAVSVIFLFGLGIVTALYTGPEADTAIITSNGPGRFADVSGKYVTSDSATLHMSVENRNSHRTPLPPHDRVQLEATVSAGIGTNYQITATEPMVADPQGRFTTWYGVGFDVWHHGRSGIGVANLPATKSNVAIYALGNLRLNGELIAAGVPVHVMTSSREDANLELLVGDPKFPLPGVPGGQFRVVWPAYEGGYDPASDYARYAWGSGVMSVLLGFALAAARRTGHPRENSEVL